jgi:3',5'-cyclic AMP phosphodiesterase CpdA
VLTILQISDLHFGPPFLPEVGEAVLRIAPRLKPDLIVVSGDLTQRAKPEQFAAAREFLARLPEVPRVVVPGNHDVPVYRVLERLTNPLGQYRRHFPEQTDRVVPLDGAVVVALDSTSPYRTITNGRVHNDQLEFCERAFRDAPAGAARIVVAHHHFVPAPDYEIDRAMPKAKRALGRFLDLGVDLILGGHLHRAYIGNTLDIYAGRHRERGIIVVQCGTTTSRRGRGREREKNSLNLIKVGAEMLRVTHYMYFSEVDEFAPLSRHIFARHGRPFTEGVLHQAD